jgi:predicted nucleic acid-binding protein
MIIADTGFFVALGNRRDQLHQIANKQLSLLQEPLITTYPVIVETSYLLAERSGQLSQFKFLQQLTSDSIQIFQLDINDLKRALVLMKKYADLPMDLADASLVVLAERLKEGRILTTDNQDFRVYRWGNNQIFDNLLR